MKSPHLRYFAFSLRALFLTQTAAAVWLGVVVHRATVQREAVKAIEALGGGVRYDWQVLQIVTSKDTQRESTPMEPGGPKWLRQIIGDDFFQEVDFVTLATWPRLSEANIRKSIPHLQRLRGLKRVLVAKISTSALNELKAALPNCEVDELPKRST